jgi:hypothetical protein
MKAILIALALAIAFLGYRIFQLESEMKDVQRNAAIAVLSAEAANNKVGAIAPYFSQDKEAFIKAWIDTMNMPSAVFPEDILTPIKRTLEEKRLSKEGQTLKASFYK